MRKLLLALLLSLTFTGCAPKTPDVNVDQAEIQQEVNQETEQESRPDGSQEEKIDENKLPVYDGQAYVVVNEDNPYFEDGERKPETFIQLSELDELGRCGSAYMCAGPETLPTEERGEIGHVKPSGWNQEKYPELIEKPGYLYNRGHLLMYALSGLNDDERNLITSTRYLNIEGMLENEDQVLDYINQTGEHVLYRVTPKYEGENLVASGVLIEARSVESDGLSLCRYAFNVQPGIEINYTDGSSWISGEKPEEESKEETVEVSYVGNKNSKIFHKAECDSVADTKPQNRVYFGETREEIVEQGYTPCKRCNP